MLSRLEALRREGLDPRGDFRQAWLAERGLQLAAEIALDVRLDPNRVAEVLADAPERSSALARAICAWLDAVG